VTDTSPLDVLRVPLAPLDLSGTYDFQKTEIRGVSLAVDSDSRTRIAAAAEVAALGVAAVSAVPYLIAMLDQDRITAAAGGLLAAFRSGSATTSDARRAENMAAFAEADLACQVAASDALASIGSTAVPALTDALQSTSPNRRSGAAKALGKVGAAAETALPLLKSLARPDVAETVRNAAAEAVKQIKPRRSLVSGLA
jgi:hypothetical protein